MTAREGDLDPRWDWIEVGEWGKAGSSYIKGRCRHLEVEPVRVESTGELVAHLCLTCDRQLPAEWQRSHALDQRTTADQACAELSTGANFSAYSACPKSGC